MCCRNKLYDIHNWRVVCLDATSTDVGQSFALTLVDPPVPGIEPVSGINFLCAFGSFAYVIGE